MNENLEIVYVVIQDEEIREVVVEVEVVVVVEAVVAVALP